MNIRSSDDWSHKVEQVIRSRHYTWLGEGLGGAPTEEALVAIATDMMHICEHEGISWDQVVEKSREQFAQEEYQTCQA